ncbi:5-amino-6-(5-phosphoribosylamino)uracil reductase [Corynebacterium cystitidis DSM 20524]|uniref:Pyrimidine reductase, riboflavin biosynthesis n=2 Tax=Corynebacterium cystitidis TaxID=35757 RepID=A0A1H9PB16_9CORY|nr:5-amino-6-(5-phosphoribosylamino)uracil reductase [Corynebacterium cystitidis DSM 20524]SER45360.1 Pyrimidine reductase, riboflavin biosynthesis [Corynebacterium cystitidis DSM 20524]SNV73418.1 putative riboflavin specific deaminase [Corynebacterium cystitidis]
MCRLRHMERIVSELVGPLAAPAVRELRAIAVTTISGTASINGLSKALGNDTDSQLLNALRVWSDVLLVGLNTVRSENYFGIQVNEQEKTARRSNGQQEVPPVAVVSRSLDFDTTAQLFWNTEIAPLILTPAGTLNDAALADRRAALEAAGATLVDTGAGTAHEIVGALHARGYSRVICEGGPGIYSMLFNADLVDVFHLTVDPQVHGPVEKHLLSFRPDGTPFSHRMTLEDAHVTDDSVLFLRYRRVR